MAAYWAVRIHVTDPESYGKYAELAGVAVEKHGGKFLARGGRQIIFEGGDYERTVITEFPSLEQAEACYNSPDYREALKFAEGAADRLLVAVEGVE
ncbi:MAG: DUF1330 domain-containing protein [Methyloligellaceae bacterium]